MTEDINAASPEEADASAVPARKPRGSAAKAKVSSKPIEEVITLQIDNGEWTLNELKEKAFDQYVSDGHRRGNIKKAAFYIKPEDRKVYYVINDKVTGSVDFE